MSGGVALFVAAAPQGSGGEVFWEAASSSQMEELLPDPGKCLCCLSTQGAGGGIFLWQLSHNC